MKRKTIAVIGGLVLLAGGIQLGRTWYYNNYQDPYREVVTNPKPARLLTDQLTKSEAKEDLDFLYEHMEEYHPAWIDGSKELVQAVQQQYEQELEQLADSVTVLQLWQAAGRICAKLHDGHTSLRVNMLDSLEITDPQVLQDGRPEYINGVSAEEIFENYMIHSSYELDEFAASMFDQTVLKNEKALQYCRIDTSSGVTYGYQKDGSVVERTYQFEQPVVSGAKATTYTVDEANGTAVLTVPECTYDETYCNTLNEFFTKVRDKGIQNIIVDLRSNGGGDSRVANEFLSYLDVDEYKTIYADVRIGKQLNQGSSKIIKNHKKNEVFSGRVYVLINNDTFSSATDWAMIVQDNHLGILVGEMSGNLPDSYGDVLLFQLPHSNLLVNISYKKWHRVDREKAGEPLVPDYECAQEAALDYAYDLIKQK